MMLGVVVFVLFGVPALLGAANHEVERSKRSDDVPAYQAELTRLATELSQLQAKHTALQNQVNTLQADHDRRLIFSAWINHEPNLAASEAAVVIFGGVITNIGSAYNPATGIFTAPYDGNYMFFVRVDISQDNFGVDIRKNGARVAAANNDGYVSTHVSAAVALTLNRNDVVAVTYFSTKGHVDAGIESIFGGYMLP